MAAITVRYINRENIYSFNSIESITDNDNVVYINCNYNKLTSLPENMNFPNLQAFYCDNNQLTSLPDNLSMIFPNLQEFYCYGNRLTSLPDNMNFPNLQQFYCSSNNLTSLPDNMNFPNLQEFSCGGNQLTSLPDNMYFPNLKKIYCNSNKLTSLPVCIMNWRNLTYIDYSGNEIELSPQLARFINRIHTGSLTKINVYSDTQNIHNTSIQCSVRDSINRLTTRRDLPKFAADTLNTMILSDNTLTEHVKSRLIEYCADESVHSLLLAYVC